MLFNGAYASQDASTQNKISEKDLAEVQVVFHRRMVSFQLAVAKDLSPKVSLSMMESSQILNPERRRRASSSVERVGSNSVASVTLESAVQLQEAVDSPSALNRSNCVLTRHNNKTWVANTNHESLERFQKEMQISPRDLQLMERAESKGSPVWPPFDGPLATFIPVPRRPQAPEPAKEVKKRSIWRFLLCCSNSEKVAPA